jgi:amidase
MTRNARAAGVRVLYDGRAMRRRELLAASETCPAGDDTLARLDGVGQAALVAQGKVGPAELVEAAIRRIEALDPALNAVVTRSFDRALRRLDRNRVTGPLAGVPYLLKDLTDWEGVRCTFGSRLFLNRIADASPELVTRSEGAGLVVLGKTNTPELGLLPSTEPLALGACRNPWDPTRSTGGSSGGAAAAVAAGLVPIAEASDGGGSIRIPAACCGVFGLSPSPNVRARTRHCRRSGSWASRRSDVSASRSRRRARSAPSRMPR